MTRPSETIRSSMALSFLASCVLMGGCAGCGGRTHPIFDAARQGDVKAVKAILDEDATLLTAEDKPRQNKPPFLNSGKSPLHCAAEGGSVEVIDLLLDRGADANGRNRIDGRFPLHYAAEHGRKAAADRLIQRGAHLNAGMYGVKSEDTALHLAALNHQRDVVELLLDRGADVDAEGSGKRTALHCLAMSDLHRCPNPERKANEALARQAGRDTAALVLQRGAKVDPQDAHGRTPLILAIDSNPFPARLSIVELLLKNGADPNHQIDTDAVTPLHIASGNSPEFADPATELAIVQKLVDRGADVKARDAKGRTPLHGARLPEIQKYLIEKGADSEAMDHDGSKPILKPR